MSLLFELHRREGGYERHDIMIQRCNCFSILISLLWQPTLLDPMNIQISIIYVTFQSQPTFCSTFNFTCVKRDNSLHKKSILQTSLIVWYYFILITKLKILKLIWLEQKYILGVLT